MGELKHMKIVVDGYGGDNAPIAIVKACIRAVNEFKDLEIVLTGKENELKNCLINNNYTGNQIEVINADDVITCDDENPAMQIKRKPNSSLVVALDILKKFDEVVALVSAGSTGAVLSGGFLKIGRIKGVSRPALAPTLPSKDAKRGVVLLDCGANADCKAINLCHFALMGSIYYTQMFGVENPKVALLSIGTEDAKGKELTKEAFAMLKKLPINFVGNMEARELISGKYDVVVSDGFAGNVALKATEGALKVALGEVKRSIKEGFWSKVGSIFMLGAFKNLKKRYDFNAYGGSPFLGCKKLIVKSHGSSKAKAIEASIDEIIILKNKNLSDRIEKAIEQANIEQETQD